jgi:hypothetical protein
MSFPTRLLRSPITYWPPAGENKFGAQSFGAPQALLGRWEDRMELIRKPGGDQITSVARVFLPIDVVPGGYLYNGDASIDPSPINAGALEIQAFTSVPDQRSASKDRRAYL